MKNRYRAAQFLCSAHKLNQLPPDHGYEVAFAGRSNAGKSSALNTLTGQKRLAWISKTPGRTQLINFFEVAPQRYLVDLPGYGYAKVPAALREHWRHTLEAYFNRRTALSGLILLMDIRHPLTPLDWQMLDWCMQQTLPVHILLTKADKLKRGPMQATLHQVRKQLPAGELSVQLFSATTGAGIDEALAVLDRWLFESQGAVDPAE